MQNLSFKEEKKIELRKWSTKFRGEFFIHASRIPYHKAMKEFGFNGLPTGCIVGKVKLTEVKKYNSEDDNNNDKNLRFASSFWGDYGFILGNPKRVKEIPMKGKLGFFEFYSSRN